MASIVTATIISLVMLFSYVDSEPSCTCTKDLYDCKSLNITSMKTIFRKDAICTSAFREIDLSNNSLVTWDVAKEFLRIYRNARIHANFNRLKTLRDLEGWAGDDLSVTHNNLSSVDLSLWRKNLKKLSISYNNLSSLDLSVMEHVSHLYAERNSLSRVDFPKEKCSLEIIWLHFNNLTSLPKELGKCKNLSEFYVHNNNLLELDISHNTNLLDINAENNGIRSFTLPEEFCAVKELNLNTNKLTTLPRTLTKCLNLRRVRLRRNYLSVFPEPLLQLMKLRSSSATEIAVDVQRNPLTLLEIFSTFRDFVQQQGLFLHLFDEDFFTIKKKSCQCSEMKLEHFAPVTYCATIMCDKQENLWQHL